jgi:hypothetical protein
MMDEDSILGQPVEPDDPDPPGGGEPVVLVPANDNEADGEALAT